MKQKLITWLISTLAIILTAFIIPQVSVSSLWVAFVAAIILGLLNTFIRPILLILTLPLNFFTLGLFTLVINAALVMLTSFIVPGFEVASFWWALLFGLVLSLVNFVLNKND